MQKAMMTASLATGALTAGAWGAIYEENFANPSGADTLETVGWKAHSGPTAVALPTTTTDTSLAPVVSDSSGFDSSGAKGFVFVGNPNPPGGDTEIRFKSFIIWTEAQNSFGQLSEIDSFSFASRNAEPAENLRVALRVGTNWIVTQQTFNQSGNTTFQQFSFDPSQASYYQINFTPGSTLTPSNNDANVTFTAASNISGTVTAIGFYDNFLNNSLRLDSVIVVPEPATLSLLGLGLLTLRRRRA